VRSEVSARLKFGLETMVGRKIFVIYNKEIGEGRLLNQLDAGSSPA
jgi:hypothetical protein